MKKLKVPSDGGMLYTETNLDWIFPEPFNALTSLLFLVIAIYWFWKLKGQYKNHAYLSFSVALLTVGAIGGSLYHGLRLWSFFIMMDWLPIMLLCVFTGIYFLVKLTKWYYAVILIVGYFIFQFYLRNQIQSGHDLQFFINLNYAILAMLVLFPVLAYLIKTRFQYGKLVGWALLAFIFALSFRMLDKYELISIGTHFLWHTFGAIAAFCMLEFLYRVNEPKIGNKKVFQI